MLYKFEIFMYNWDEQSKIDSNVRIITGFLKNAIDDLDDSHKHKKQKLVVLTNEVFFLYPWMQDKSI